MIYGAHAEKRGLLFAFTFDSLTQADFEELVSAGFDDVFEMHDLDRRKFSRMYSWIRRFGGSPISGADAERDAITFLSQRDDKQIGRWTIVSNEKVARDSKGQRVELTRQEVDFLALLFESPDAARNASYGKFFKAPHAIVHKLRKKLGNDLPLRHNGGGRYSLAREDRVTPSAARARVG
jgi:hypothetical protein